MDKYLAILLLGTLVACQSNHSEPTIEQQTRDTQIVKNEPAPPVAKSVVYQTDTSSYSFDLEYLMGKFNPAKHPDFARIESKHTSKSNVYLRKETYEAFIKMYEAAKVDGISLIIHSATRNFFAQKRIWEAKWTGARLANGGQNLAKNYPDPTERALQILMFSSMPGTSRHHWGTDIDMNSFNNSYFEQGKGLKEYQWLQENAPKFGFCQVYSPKGEARPNGYQEEKWHWSYIPVARRLTNLAKTSMRDEAIQGFKGAETAGSIGVTKKYILGINPVCF